jgi:cell division protein ZapA (FtsZ GTPase activity inhibitor)
MSEPIKVTIKIGNRAPITIGCPAEQEPELKAAETALNNTIDKLSLAAKNASAERLLILACLDLVSESYRENRRLQSSNQTNTGAVGELPLAALNAMTEQIRNVLK